MNALTSRLVGPLRQAMRHTPAISAVTAPTLARCFATDGKLEGTVKWFDPMKGFGFIVPAEGGDDVFVHHTAIHAEGFRSLGENEPVEYDTVLDDRTGKMRAENVTGPDGSYVQGNNKFDQYGNRMDAPQGEFE